MAPRSRPFSPRQGAALIRRAVAIGAALRADIWRGDGRVDPARVDLVALDDVRERRGPYRRGSWPASARVVTSAGMFEGGVAPGRAGRRERPASVYLALGNLGTLYLGSSAQELRQRLAEHGSRGRGGVGSTKTGDTRWRVVWSRQFASVAEAEAEEIRLLESDHAQCEMAFELAGKIYAAAVVEGWPVRAFGMPAHPRQASLLPLLSPASGAALAAPSPAF